MSPIGIAWRSASAARSAAWTVRAWIRARGIPWVTRVPGVTSTSTPTAGSIVSLTCARPPPSPMMAHPTEPRLDPLDHTGPIGQQLVPHRCLGEAAPVDHHVWVATLRLDQPSQHLERGAIPDHLTHCSSSSSSAAARVARDPGQQEHLPDRQRPRSRPSGRPVPRRAARRSTRRPRGRCRQPRPGGGPSR